MTPRPPLRSFRHGPAAQTRHLLALCGNTPLALDFPGGHWLSVYAALWPAGVAPQASCRTMTADRADRASLPSDIPNARPNARPNALTQPIGFMCKLLVAWIAMGLRHPKIATQGEVDA